MRGMSRSCVLTLGADGTAKLTVLFDEPGDRQYSSRPALFDEHVGAVLWHEARSLKPDRPPRSGPVPCGATVAVLL
jgi:hypothetical protein